MSSAFDLGHDTHATWKEFGMGKLLWHTVMSLDGFVAGPNQDMSWIFGLDGGSGETVDAVVGSTGALLVGRRTQDVEDRLQPGFYGGAFRGPFFVLRHDPPPDPPVVKGVTGRFLDVGIEEAVTIAKGAAGDGDVVILGANIARQCLENGLLDEIIVHVAPVLVGDGVRMFERAGHEPLKLDPISSIDEGGMTVLRYAVGRAAAS
jgi:dihydrofolate reductase